jgi:hypothetical protein
MMTDVMDFARAREIYGAALTRYFRQARVQGESGMIDARSSSRFLGGSNLPIDRQTKAHSAKRAEIWSRRFIAPAAL